LISAVRLPISVLMKSCVPVPSLREPAGATGAGIPLHGIDPEKTNFLESRFSGNRHSGSEVWSSGKYAQIAQFSGRVI